MDSMRTPKRALEEFKEFKFNIIHTNIFVVVVEIQN